MTHAHTYGNVPGYLPDSDPDTFATFREAVSAQVADVRDYIANGGATPRVTMADHGKQYPSEVDGSRLRWLEIVTTDRAETHLAFVYTATECDMAECAPHVGHFSRLGGTWWCDTCDSPYCDLA